MNHEEIKIEEKSQETSRSNFRYWILDLVFEKIILRDLGSICEISHYYSRQVFQNSSIVSINSIISHLIVPNSNTQLMLWYNLLTFS
jgi:hypothetical protein